MIIPFKVKLNLLFIQLRKCGWVAHQDFRCCQSCAFHDIGETDKAVVFYHNQDTPSIRKGYVMLSHANLEPMTLYRLANNLGICVIWNGKETQRIRLENFISDDEKDESN